MIGIYKIENITNNKVYVGSSTDIQKRWTKHLYELKTNKHPNTHLQSSFNKYGVTSFTFSIIEIVENIKDIFIIEANWITKLNSIDKGYNMTLPLPNGYQPTSEEGKKKRTLAHNKRMRSIITLNKLTGEFIKEYETSGLAAKDLGYRNYTKIQRVLSGQQPSYKGLVFVYKDKYDPNKDYRVIGNQSGLNRRQKVFQYSIDGELVKIWDTTIELQKEGYNINTLYTVIYRNKLYKNYYWKRA